MQKFNDFSMLLPSNVVQNHYSISDYQINVNCFSRLLIIFKNVTSRTVPKKKISVCIYSHCRHSCKILHPKKWKEKSHSVTCVQAIHLNVDLSVSVPNELTMKQLNKHSTDITILNDTYADRSCYLNFQTCQMD